MKRRSFITKAVAVAAGLFGGAAAVAGSTPKPAPTPPAGCGPGCGCGHPSAPAEGGNAGFGRCFRIGCNCRGFEGSGYTCSNCGHNFDAHGY